MSDVDAIPGQAGSIGPDDATPYGEQLRGRAAEDPDGTAVIVVACDGSQTALSWDELERCANRWGRVLAGAGAGIGSMVALPIPNSVDLIVSTLGCWKIGAIPIPMRWDLPAWERTRLLEVIDPAVLVDDDSRAGFAAAASRQPDGPLPAVVSPAVNGICSSGSTGLPKVILNTTPAMWTPQHGEPFLAHWTSSVSRPQTILVPGPMYHTNGFSPLNNLLGGDRLIVLEKFSAAAVLDAVEQHRITTFTATPTMLARIADFPGAGERDLTSVEWILQGAAVMPAALLLTWFELLSPEHFVMAYGMTENLGLTALRGDEWLNHRGSVGRGFRDTEIKILGPCGDELPAGELGEIYLRAPMSGTYRYVGGAPPLPATVDGFRSAGDLGFLDSDGYLYVADRRADMIVTGGANVYPAEVESALAEHPEIADVVVIGLADAQWGRRVHAVVQAKAGRTLTGQQVIGYAKSRLAGYKVPKTVEFVDEIPRTAATKVNRSAMIEARGG